MDKGFLYSGGNYTDIIPPGWTSARAQAVNNAGAVVGYGYTGSMDKGFLYSGGNYTDIIPSGWTSAWALGINASGAVVGRGNNGSTNKGFLYSAGNYTDITPPGWTSSEALAINDNGAIVGHRATGSTDKGFLYSAGNYTDIIPPGWTSAWANGINNSGTVVGGGTPGLFRTRGFVYSGGTSGTYTELLPPGWTSSEAIAINDNGVIVGYGIDDNGVTKGFVASPSIHLVTGWNFITFATTPTSPSSPIGTVLADVLSHVIIAWGYDNVNKAWLKYRPGTEGSSLTTVETGKGYWIYMDAPGTINAAGWTGPPSTTIHLSQGWNLIGYVGKDGTGISAALNSVAGKLTSVWGWDNGQWSLYAATLTLPLSIQPLSVLSQGKAYWIRATEATDWTE